MKCREILEFFLHWKIVVNLDRHALYCKSTTNGSIKWQYSEFISPFVTIFGVTTRQEEYSDRFVLVFKIDGELHVDNGIFFIKNYGQRVQWQRRFLKSSLKPYNRS